MPYFTELIVFAASYLVGSILFAVWFTRWFGLSDPRTIGSGNPGASNVTREHGKWVGACVLGGDILKGFIPVWLVQQLGLPDLLVAVAAVGTYLGHLFPLYARGKGGKGVATLIGCLLGFNLWVAAITIIIWAVSVRLSRYVCVGSMLIGLVAPVLMWWAQQPVSWTLAAVLMGILIIVKHHDNISRLLAGTEVQIGKNP